MVMKLLEFLQLPIMQLLKTVIEYFNKKGEGDNFRTLTLEKSQILECQSSQKKEKNYNILQLFRSVELFDVFYHNHHVWMDIVLQIKFYCDFPDFGHSCSIS